MDEVFGTYGTCPGALLPAHQAEALGARLVERYGRPSHYVLDESRSDFVTEGGVATMSEPCMQWMRLGP
jgi:hypothetical protein